MLSTVAGTESVFWASQLQERAQETLGVYKVMRMEAPRRWTEGGRFRGEATWPSDHSISAVPTNFHPPESWECSKKVCQLSNIHLDAAFSMHCW